MDLNAEQILALAPDASAVATARKLAAPRLWRSLGRDERAVWGECQGSALYQVRASLSDLSTKCSCPSRKLPCKHSLGLLLLAASDAVSRGVAPDWVTEWMERREATATRRETRATTQGAPDLEAQAKRAEARRAKVDRGVEALDLWMNDLVRHGLASIETKPPSFWEAQAARLVDAQASALAGRIRRIAFLVGASRDWPERVLDELGKTALLTHAFRRLDALPAPLRADVRHLIGWTTPEAEVERDGERLADAWLSVGQVLEDDERVRMRRTWLYGTRSQRMALLLDFAVAGASLGDAPATGTVCEAEAVFWPSAAPARALLREWKSTNAWRNPLPGTDVEGLVGEYARALAALPWSERRGFALREVCIVHAGGAWFARDTSGNALPLGPGDHTRLLAVSGGHPVGLAGEWDGRALRPLAVVASSGCLPLRSLA